MNIKDNIKYIPALIITALLFIPFPPETIKIYLHSVLPITVIIVMTITLLCLYKKNCPKIITLFPQYFSLFNTILFVNTSRFIFDITLLKFDESYYVAKIVKDAFEKNIYFGYLQVALGFLAVYVIYRVFSRLSENKNVRIMQITLWTMLIISFAVLFGCSLNGYFKYEMTVFHSFIFYLPYSCCQFILWSIPYFLLYVSLTIPEELSITANNIEEKEISMTENEFNKIIEGQIGISFLQKFGGHFCKTKYEFIYFDGENNHILPDNFENLMLESLKTWKNRLIEL